MSRLLPLAGCALAAGAAMAQDDAVVVTATRAPQPAMEVPASVDRIYGEEIREGRPQINLSESLGRVPGIVVQNRQNYAQDLQIQSRGFGARSTFGVRGIRLIADGIPASMPDGQGQAATFALGSARSIEVLRGPFSTLYGNSAGGVINVETEEAPAQPFAEADVLLGSYDTRRIALKSGAQLGPLNAIGDLSRFETDGYRDHSAARRDHLNAKLRYGLWPATSLTFVLNTLRQPDSQDPGGLTRAQMEQDPRQVVATQISNNARKTILHEQAGLTLAHRMDGGARLQASAYGGERWVEQFLNIPLATQTATATHSGAVVSLDRGFGGGSLRLTQEASLMGRPVRLSFGGEHERMTDRRRGYLNVNGVAGALRRDEDNEVQTSGVYAQGEWKFAERWAAHAGLRRTSVAFRNADYFLSNGDDSGDRRYRATTPVAGLVFQPARNLSLYGNLGRGFETPTFVELANRAAGSGLNFGLEASRSRHAEVGAKAVVPGWVRVNAAVFRIVTENEIVVETNAGGRASFKNVGHTDREGFELAADTLLGGPFEARVAYTYLDARYREGFNTVVTVGGPTVPVPAGNVLPGVPQRTLYGELRYRTPAFFAQLEGLRKGRVAVNDTNSDFADPFTVWNAALGLTQQSGGWKFTEFVRVDNLTDRTYAGSVIVNENNGRYFEPSPRRNISIGLQARMDF